MKGLLLLAPSEIGAIILVVFAVLGIVIIIAIKQNRIKIGKSKMSIDRVDGSSFLDLNLPYLSKKEVKFYETIKKVLPKEYCVFPRVGIANIVKPKGNLTLYNSIQSAFVDMCVFLKSNMQPIAIIDLVDRSVGGDSTLNQQDNIVTKALNGVNIPVIVYEIKMEYDLAQLLEKFLDVLDPLAIAELRRARLNEKQ